MMGYHIFKKSTEINPVAKNYFKLCYQCREQANGC